MHRLAALLIFTGLILVISGGLLFFLPRIHFLKLPGNIIIKHNNLTIVFPVVISIIVSLLLTIILNLLLRK